MADAKRDRQRAARQAKIEAELAAKKRAARQRQAIIGGAIFAVLAAVVLIVNRGEDDDTVETSTTTSIPLESVTTAPGAAAPGAAESAAGKPCVPRSQPLPEGAPEVDVAVGPPPTSLVARDLTLGSGPSVPPNATVTVQYIGVACSTGVIFDASYGKTPPAPVTFALNGVIPGWSQGIPGMAVGGKRLLGVPPDLAYGDDGSPNGTFAPQETLWFVVELVDFKPPA